MLSVQPVLQLGSRAKVMLLFSLKTIVMDNVVLVVLAMLATELFVVIMIKQLFRKLRSMMFFTKADMKTFR
jgi:hypothetical protein